MYFLRWFKNGYHINIALLKLFKPHLLLSIPKRSDSALIWTSIDVTLSQIN